MALLEGTTAVIDVAPIGYITEEHLPIILSSSNTNARI